MKKSLAGVISFLIVPLVVYGDVSRQRGIVESRFHRLSPIFSDRFSVLPLPLGTSTPTQAVVDGAKIASVGALGGSLGTAVINSLPYLRSSQLPRQTAFIGQNWAVYGKISGQMGRERLLHLGNLATGAVVGAAGAAVARIAYGGDSSKSKQRLIAASLASALVWGAGSAIRIVSWRAFLPGFFSGAVAGVSAAGLAELF